MVTGAGQGCGSAARSKEGACSWWDTGAAPAFLCCLGSAVPLSLSEDFLGFSGLVCREFSAL